MAEIKNLNNDSVRFKDGSNSSPSISFISDPNTGLYTDAADSIKITTGGGQRVRVDSNGVGVSANIYIPTGYKMNFDYGVSNNYFVRKDSTTLYMHSPVNLSLQTDGNHRLYINQSGNVGIGTTSVSDGDLGLNNPKLHVRGVDTAGVYSLVARFQSGSDANDTGAAIAINHSNDRGLLIKAGRKDSDRPVAFFDLIDSNGSTTNMLTMGEYGSEFRTGIGTTAPVATLDVAGTGRFTDKVQITGSTTIGWGDIANSYLLVGTDNAGIGIDSNEIAAEGSHLYFGTITSGHNIVFRSGGLNEMWMTSDTLFYKSGFKAGFENATSDNTIYLQNTGGTGVSKLDIGGTVLIEEGGNVGIGTTSPQTKLHVVGTVTVSDGTILSRYNSGWTNNPTTDVIYNGWTTNTGDYIVLRSPGNSTSTEGALAITNTKGLFIGQHATTGAITDSSTDPLSTTWARLGATSWVSGSLGIGVNNPSSKLDLYSVSAGAVRISTPGYTNVDLYSERTSGNLGGIRWQQDIAAYKEAEINAVIDGGIEIKVGDGDSAPALKFKLDPGGELTLHKYGAGFLKTNASGVVSVDTTSYSTFSGDYDDLTNKPTLGTAASAAATDFVAVTGDTMTGNLAVTSASGDASITITAAQNAVFNINSAADSFVEKDTGNHLYIANNVDDKNVYLRTKTGGATSIVLTATGTTKNIGIGTTLPAERLHVAGNLYVSNTYNRHIIKQLPYMYMGGSSITDEYLVIMKKNLGTGVTATGISGKIKFQRGSVSNGNDLAEYEIVMQSAYTDNAFWKFTRSGANVYERIDEITIGGTAYYALKVRGNGGGPTLTHIFEGQIYTGTNDPYILTRVRESDSDVTVVSTGVYYPDYQQLSSNYMQGSLGVGTNNPNAKLHVTDSIQVDGGDTFGVDNSGHQIYMSSGGTGLGGEFGSGYARNLIKSDGNATIHIGDNTSLISRILLDAGSTSANGYISLQTNQSERVRIANNGNVGIGTTSPAASLHIEKPGDQASSVKGIVLSSGAAGTNKFLPSITWSYGASGTPDFAKIEVQRGGGTSGRILFSTANSSGTMSEALRVNEDGNVGIGTASPTGKLEVAGNVKIGSTTTGLNLSQSGNDFLIQGVDVGGNAWNSIHLQADSLTGLYIEKDTNNVGIGTTTPGAKLEVAGNTLITGNANVNAQVRAGYQVSTGDARVSAGDGRTGDGNAYVDLIGDTTYTSYGLRLWRAGGLNASSYISHRGTGTMYIRNLEAAAMHFQTGSTDKMVISSGGNVGIGTTNPNYKLDVSGTSRIGGTSSNLALFVTSTSTFGAAISFEDVNTGGNDVVHAGAKGSGFYIATNYSERLLINSSGNLQLSAYGAGILQTDASGNVTAGTASTLVQSNIYSPVGWKLTASTYTAGGQDITSSTTQAYSGTTPVTRTSSTVFTATTAGTYEVRYQFVIKNNYANRCIVGAQVKDTSGSVILGSRSFEYLRYTTYGEYNTIQATFYTTIDANNTFNLETALRSGSLNYTLESETGANAGYISFRLIKES